MEIKARNKIYLIILILSIILLISNLFVSYNIIKNKERIVTSVNMSNNLVEIVKKVKPAVVQIISETNSTPDSSLSSEIIKINTGWASVGTGFFIDSGGYIATANHVVDNSKKITVIIFRDNKAVSSHEAKIIKQNPKTDTAIIKIEGKDYPFLELRSYDDSNEGEDIGFIGFPLGTNFPTINKGIVSSKISIDSTSTYTINAFINPGNSGGPLFSLEDGKVLGVINSKIQIIPPNLYITPINLSNSGGVAIIGIDFGQLVGVTIDTRNLLLETIDKTSNVGIGYSVSSDYLKNYKEK